MSATIFPTESPSKKEAVILAWLGMVSVSISRLRNTFVPNSSSAWLPAATVANVISKFFASSSANA